MEEPKVIALNKHTDGRGTLEFCNEFNILELGIKRFYTVENSKINTIRAWHGHKKEEKFIIVIQGEAIISAITMGTGEIKEPVKIFRKKQKLTSEKIAIQLGISRAHYTHLENGTRSITPAIAKKMAEVFNVDESEFLDEIKKQNKLKNWTFHTSSKFPQIIHIPPGFYNGTKTLTENTKLLIFSTSTTEESANDDFRKDSRWASDIWKIGDGVYTS